MKKGLLLLAVGLCLSLSSQLFAQQIMGKPIKATTVIQGKDLKPAVDLQKWSRDTRDLNDMKQESKWLTNIPMDSAFYNFKMYGFSDNCSASYSTLIEADLVERFVGNKITTIKTALPAGGYNLTFWIIDPWGVETEPYWSTYVDGSYMGGVFVDVPCDYVIDKAKYLQIGYTVEFPAGLPELNFIVAPCFRDYTCLISSTSQDFTPGMTYNYSNYFMYAGKKQTYFSFPFFCVTEGDNGLKPNDFQFNGISHSKVLIGDDADLNASFINMGCNPVSNVAFEYTVGEEGGVINHNKPVPFLGSGSFKATVSTDEKAERIPIKVKVRSINKETVAEDISAEGSVTAIDPDKSVERKVVMEEYGGTWCGWCPRGMVGMEMLKEEYPDHFIPIGVHYGDPMQHESFSGLINNYEGGYPGCILNRVKQTDPYYGDDTNTPFGIDNQILPIINRPTESTVTIDAVSLSADGKKLNVTASAQFFIDCNVSNAPYSFAYVITEDGVNGKNLPAAERKNYLQSNYFANNSSYKNEEYLKHLVSQPSYWETDFNHVARFYDKEYGISGSLPASFQSGDVLKHTYEINLPSHINDINKCTLIAMLIDNGSGEIVNAEQVAISSATGLENVAVNNQVAEVVVTEGGIQVNATTATAYVYTTDGRLVLKQAVNGNQAIALEKGSYVVRVESGNNVFAKKVVL